jgi:predicted GNAT family N-acyltransferase
MSSSNAVKPPDGLTIRRFRRETSPEDFERALRLRLEVFVEEQAVPLEDEQDEVEDEAWHWLLFAETTGEVLATGRLVSYQEGCQTRPVAKISRIAVKRSHRGRRLGEAMMLEILQTARQEGYAQAVLDSQTHALPFYEKLGFVAEGDVFEDCGIAVCQMRFILD